MQTDYNQFSLGELPDNIQVLVKKEVCVWICVYDGWHITNSHIEKSTMAWGAKINAYCELYQLIDDHMEVHAV